MHTKDEIISLAKSVHGDTYDYSQVPDDVRMSSVVDIVCGVHGIYRQSFKNHINLGQGCPICGKEKKRENSRKNGLKKFLKTCNERFDGKYSYPNIDDEYKGSHSRITVHCNDCDSEFVKIACDHISSSNGGCRKCMELSRKETYTYDELAKLSNGNVKIKNFEGIVARNESVVCICDVHGEYSVLAGTIVDGRGYCRRCSNRNTLEETKEITEKLKLKVDSLYKDKFNVDFSNIKGMSSKIRFVCCECGYEFERMVGVVLRNGYVGCRRCLTRENARERIKTTEEFVKQAKLLYGDLYDYSMTKYISSDSKVAVGCNRCGRIFSVEANSHLQGHGCPYHYTNKSMDETEILNYIKSIYKGTVYNNDRKTLGDGTELDILIPEKNIAIEYNGLYWHNELNKPRDYHLDKTDKCRGKNIKLIHIFEDEWKNPIKKEIWKSMLANKLGLIKEKVYARNCEIGLVKKSLGYQFLERNHIQGKCPCSLMVGLYYKGEVVSIMTFGKTRHFIGNSTHEYELLRFCNKVGVSVVGGASRLFSWFIKECSPKSVVSYADYRWSDGMLYETLGFTMYNKSKPNYYYVIGANRRNRFNFRKSALVRKYGCPKEMSEHEFCLSRKWYRIYDCGCLCYEWKKEQ